MSQLSNPIEQLVQKNIKCHTCGRTHRTNLRTVLIARGALQQLPQVMGRFHGRHIHIISDENTMVAAGNEIVRILGGQGFDINNLILSPVIGPNDADLGHLTLSIPRETAAVIAVGSGSLHELVKYWSFKSGVPFVSVPTAASSDGFAMPTSIFLESGRKKLMKAESPVAMIADLDVILAAPKTLAPRGAAEVLSRMVSVFDWKLAQIVDERFFCEDIAESLLSVVSDFVDSLQGSRPLYSVRSLEMLMRALIFSGVVVSYAESTTPVWGSESLLTECLFMTRSFNPSAIGHTSLLKAIASATCVRISESIAGKLPNFPLAATLMEYYGWITRHQELVRIYGDEASTIFSNANSYTSHNKDVHKKNLSVLETRWEDIVSATMEIVRPYSEYREILRSCTLPYRFEDAGTKKSSAIDAILWSKELAEHYNLLTLVWELGEIDSVADALTARMKDDIGQ